MKTYEGVEVWLYAFLISILVGSKFSASRSGSFNPGKEAV
jgi:hypothetical protein